MMINEFGVRVQLLLGINGFGCVCVSDEYSELRG